jgi:methyl-accepting chemotaxis protein
MTLRLKLIAGFSGMLAVFLCVALFNVYQVKSIKEQLAYQNEKVELKQSALELKEMVQELNVIASGLEISKNPEYIPVYNEKRKQFDQMVKHIGDTATTPDQIAWRSKLISLTVDYANTFDVAAKLVQENKLQTVDMEKNMEYLYNESQKLKDEIFKIVDNFYVVYSEDAKTAIESSRQMLNKTVAIMITALLLVLALSGCISFLLIRSFTRPIGRLQQAVKRIAEGDLRHKINNPSKDELGLLSQNFDNMIDQVRNMLANTQSIASSLSGHSQLFHDFANSTAAANSEIVRAIHEISAGAEHQAEHSEKSAYLIAELEQEIQSIALFTNKMLEASKEASINTHIGSSAIISLQAASEVSEQVLENVFAEIESLNASSQQISNITATISEISMQTNVLSLNASIEAARAGVYGKSFTVIAEQVRHLSAQTAESSKRISQMIGTLQMRMKDLQNSVTTARETMNQQNGKLTETISAFETIRHSMDELIGHIDNIHDKMIIAKSKNELLVESVQHVAAIAQETAAGVEEVNSASLMQDSSIRQIVTEANGIHALSQKLFNEVNKFQIGSTEPDNSLHPEEQADEIKETQRDDAPDKEEAKEEEKEKELTLV